jgi:hypothetical protein
VVGVEEVDHEPTDALSVGFTFGANQLWVDGVEAMSQVASR